MGRIEGEVSSDLRGSPKKRYFLVFFCLHCFAAPYWSIHFHRRPRFFPPVLYHKAKQLLFQEKWIPSRPWPPTLWWIKTALDESQKKSKNEKIEKKSEIFTKHKAEAMFSRWGGSGFCARHATGGPVWHWIFVKIHDFPWFCRRFHGRVFV